VDGTLQDGLAEPEKAKNLEDSGQEDRDRFPSEKPVHNPPSQQGSPFSQVQRFTRFGLSENYQMDLEELRKAWCTSDCNTREDWEEWFRSLSVTFLQQSSSPVLRECYSLAQSNPNVARGFFKYSLLSVWSRLDKESREDLQDTLQEVSASPDPPADVIQSIDSLGEYLDSIVQSEPQVTSDLTDLETLAHKCKRHVDTSNKMDK